MSNFVRAAKELDTHFTLMEMRQGMSEKVQIEADIKELELELKTKATLLEKHKGTIKKHYLVAIYLLFQQLRCKNGLVNLTSCQMHRLLKQWKQALRK